jgi:hypothetical protein
VSLWRRYVEAGLAFEEAHPDAFNTRPHQHGLEDRKVAETHAVHAKSVGRGMPLLVPREIEAVRTGATAVAARLGYQLA